MSLPQLLEPSGVERGRSKSFEKERAVIAGGGGRLLERDCTEELRTAEKISAYLRFTVDDEGFLAVEVDCRGREARYFCEGGGAMGGRAGGVEETGAWSVHAMARGGRSCSGAGRTRRVRKFCGSLSAERPVARSMRSWPRRCARTCPRRSRNFAHLYGALLAESDGDEVQCRLRKREELRQVLRHPAGPTGFPWQDMEHHWDRAVRDKYRKLEAKPFDKMLVESPHAPPRAMVVEDDAENLDRCGDF